MKGALTSFDSFHMFEHIITFHILNDRLVLIVDVYELLLRMLWCTMLTNAFTIMLLLILKGTACGILVGTDSIGYVIIVGI
jgi:hypothetical protein